MKNNVFFIFQCIVIVIDAQKCLKSLIKINVTVKPENPTTYVIISVLYSNKSFIDDKYPITY